MTGVWIFTIHMIQFIDRQYLSGGYPGITIDYRDYFPFFAGIFLVSEGLYRISGSKEALYPGQVTRIIRVIIGTCLITLHLLQFIYVLGKAG